jgi:hypothetical protein
LSKDVPTQDEISDAQLVNMYTQCKAFVLPHAATTFSPNQDRAA